MLQAVHDGWGERVKGAREAHGLSQRFLAQLCGVDASTVCRIERGVLVPRDRQKWKIAGALGVTVEELFPYPSVVPPAP